MDYEEYRRFDAVGLAELVARGEVSASELLELAIARAEAVHPRLNLYALPMHDIARKRAAAELSGPFAGVPFLIKDLGQDYQGLPTGSGSRSLRGHRAAEHAVVVQRWLDAGLVIFGKTTTPEFGTKAVTESLATGPTRNPWNLDHTPGGSSGGTAAAVAAGVVPVAGASDGGGSIRIPAACCGLFGLKPGRGVVPAGPLRAESFHGAATDGVISRTVRDSAAMLDVLTAKPDLAGPYLSARPEDSYLNLAAREPGKLRIGFTTRSPIDGPVDAEAVAAVEHAAKVLAELGHEVEPAEPGINGNQLAEDFLAAWCANAAFIMAQIGGPKSGYELDTHLLAAAAWGRRAPEQVATLARWHVHARALAAFHERYDLLLTPTLARPPVRVGELDTPPAVRALGEILLRLKMVGVFSRTKAWRDQVVANLAPVPYTQLANITGRPAMSVPLHQTARGLPLGVQFVGGLGAEPTLLALASQLEAHQPWADRRPTAV
ncbi:amidase [Kutzneria sp. NPDC052558]|uniref:amidase n=1 Tax=Kutzneria sp. NPDC052558 TaxID=3364121 RepID=UPI0037C7724E